MSSSRAYRVECHVLYNSGRHELFFTLQTATDHTHSSPRQKRLDRGSRKARNSRGALATGNTHVSATRAWAIAQDRKTKRRK